MFFTPGTHKDHGLRYNPFLALIAPRPIGWISSLTPDGTANLAPYSFFNAMSASPPMVGYAVAPSEHGDKDSLTNVRDTGDFVVNIVSEAQLNAMNITSSPLPRGESEFALAGLEMLPSNLVKAPRVKNAPCHLECKLWDILPLPPMPDGKRNHWVMGTVIGIHIDQHIITDGKVDVLKFTPATRLGYQDYALIENIFELKRPQS